MSPKYVPVAEILFSAQKIAGAWNRKYLPPSGKR